MNIIVAISRVSDGNMHIVSDKSNSEVINNRKSFLRNHGINIKQTTRIGTVYEGNDYCRYHEVTSTQKGDGMFDGNVVTSDALVTKDANHALFLPIADCIGAVIFDQDKNILMLSHIGRHAIEQNGGYKSIKYLIDNYGCIPSSLLVWLSPAPGSDSYPLFKFNNRSLKEVVLEQFIAASVSMDHINNNSSDTSTNKDYFSHSEFLKGNRPNDGRFAMVAMMQNK